MHRTVTATYSLWLWRNIHMHAYETWLCRSHSFPASLSAHLRLSLCPLGEALLAVGLVARLLSARRGYSGLAAAPPRLFVDPPPPGVRRLLRPATPILIGVSVMIRSDLARALIERVKQLVPLVGDASIATQICLLKRDLSLCHDALRWHPAERNFLSIVTLIESAMAQLKWEQYSCTQLNVFNKALNIGCRQMRVTFADYKNVRILFSQQKVDATPRIQQ